MQSNIGLLDRYIRFTTGAFVLASAVQMRRNSLAKNALLLFGASKLAEGVTGFCPLLYAAGVRNPESEQNAQTGQNQNAASVQGTPWQSQNQSQNQMQPQQFHSNSASAGSDGHRSERQHDTFQGDSRGTHASDGQGSTHESGTHFSREQGHSGQTQRHDVDRETSHVH
ncbi:DUF2892 domain-containing protein [Alicyclobacillus tolerans]|uniref:YgaP family membrane protein n=1 Tax=Alicyclobacillus tolerans TaxID=90970 RepID=UPI001F352C24|nr:DUF2892 domain-containing protein [Alicyclobacillus tolerans]MCF8564503.1 DUF2892 domain-containing protein [Alicyclobacillus tolerans]